MKGQLYIVQNYLRIVCKREFSFFKFLCAIVRLREDMTTDMVFMHNTYSILYTVKTVIMLKQPKKESN